MGLHRVATLFVSQRHDRVDAHRPPCGNLTRQQRHHNQEARRRCHRGNPNPGVDGFRARQALKPQGRLVRETSELALLIE